MDKYFVMIGYYFKNLKTTFDLNSSFNIPPNPLLISFFSEPYLLKTGFPIVSSVQSSVLLVMPGSDGSNGEMPTPNILADPSHLIHCYKHYEEMFGLTSADPY